MVQKAVNNVEAHHERQRAEIAKSRRKKTGK